MGYDGNDTRGSLCTGGIDGLHQSLGNRCKRHSRMQHCLQRHDTHRRERWRKRYTPAEAAAHLRERGVPVPSTLDEAAGAKPRPDEKSA